MKIGKKGIVRLIILVSLALYNFLLFMLSMKVDKNPTFWISYGFVMATPLVLLLLTFAKLPYIEEKLFVASVPASRAFAIYYPLAFIVSTLFMVLMKKISPVTVLLVQIPLLLVFLLIFLFLLKGERQGSDKLKRQKEEVFALGTNEIKLNSIASAAPAHLADKIRTLAEKVKYSDYHQYPELRELENDIKTTISALQHALGDEAEAEKLIAKLSMLLDERTESCKILKKRYGS